MIHELRISDGDESTNVTIESDLTVLELEELIESENTIMEVR